jgi:hypothetical protein
MKKLFKTTALLMLGMGLGACSNEDDIVAPTTTAEEGETAYINVQIASADDATTRAEAGEFIYGTLAEQKVANARFLFYDASGNYVCEAHVWQDGGKNEETPDENVEYWGSSVLVLTGVTQTNYPTSMVTILNAPSSFSAPKTLDAMQVALAGNCKNSDNDNFIITTSSYDQGDTKYFVTPLTSANFKTSADDAKAEANRVEVYVERLAAKVVVTVDESKLTKVENQTNLYKLANFTVAGQDTARAIYVKLLGWDLNCTTKDSYYMKNIKCDQTITNFEWKPAGLFRTYWGHSYNYDNNSFSYPSAYAKNMAAGLNYISANEIQNGFTTTDNYDYCNENTNTPTILANHYPSAVTSVIVKAKITDEKGEGIDVIRYNGLLFEPERYIDYVLSSLNAAGELNYYNSEKMQISADDVELQDSPNLNGQVFVQLKDTASTTTYYSDTTAASPKTISYKNINAALAEFNDANTAVAYKGGLMYYNIPIKHLNTKVAPTKSGSTYTIAEGYYGVVRNHCYSVTINDIQHIGAGIFNPGEPIVPTDDEDTYYHVGARINILSWKNVSQTVVL